MKHLFSTLALVTCMAATAQGQVKVVNASGTGDFTTINDALAFFDTDTDPAENVIQISDDAAYNEIISISEPVTIEGTGAERARLILKNNPDGISAKGGIVINLPSTLSTGTVTLKNIVILPEVVHIPKVSTTPAQRVTAAIENVNNNLCLILDNVLISANDGTDQPLMDNGYDNDILKLVPSNAAYDPDATSFALHGLVLGRSGSAHTELDGVELILKDSIITHIRGDYQPAAVQPDRTFPRGIWMYNPYGTNPANYENPAINSIRRITRVLGDSAVSFTRFSMSIAGDLEMSNPGGRIHMRGAGNVAIDLDGPAMNFRNIEDVYFTGNSAVGVTDHGWGSVRWNMKNCVSFETLNNVISVNNQTNQHASGLINIEDSTLVGGRWVSNSNTTGQGPTHHTFRLSPGTETDVNISNTILGGKRNHTTATVNVIYLGGTNDVTISDSAIITDGPFSFYENGATLVEGSSVLTTTNIINADPGLLGWDMPVGIPFDPSVEDFMDVTNPLYATAGANGEPLKGGARYAGPSTRVDNWSVY